MTLRTTGLLALVAAFALPATAFADVYLNGVNITGVTNQTFEKATVHIDAQGNVHIKAPGYAVSGASAGGKDQASSSQSAPRRATTTWSPATPAPAPPSTISTST